jgi:hypothetical protein
MEACLEFAFLVKEEIFRRTSAQPLSFGDRQLLQAACAKIPVTSDVAPKKLKRARSKVEWYVPLIYPSFEWLTESPSVPCGDTPFSSHLHFHLSLVSG